MLDIAPHLTLDLSTFIGERAAILGITGSGKTNTAAVLVEELLTQHLPMSIVDTEGEYWGLKERFDILVTGKSAHVELPLAPNQAALLAHTSVERSIPIILDVSGYKKAEAQEVLEQYFTALWDACSEHRQPYEVVLEEAHVWIPQDKNTPLKELLTEIALRGRKRGLGIILASQRSAKVEKDILTQVPLLFLHRVVHPIDMSVYKGLIPLPAKEVEQLVGNLQQGEAVIVHKNVPQVDRVRLRHTFHPGATPEWGKATTPELHPIDASLLRDLQAMLAHAPSAAPSENSRLQRAEKRIKELELLLAERDATIAKQAEQIEMLSRLTVSVDDIIAPTVKLPETMHVGQATIERATVNHAMTPSYQTPTIVEASPSRQVTQHLPAKQVQVPFNESKFLSLIRRLQKVGDLEIRMWRILEQQKRSLTSADIAAWLNLSESRITSNPPRTLIGLKLVSRTKGNRAYLYSSLLQEYLTREFPGANIEQLIRRVFDNL